MLDEVVRYSNRDSFRALCSPRSTCARRQVFVEIKRRSVVLLTKTGPGLACLRRSRWINRWRGSVVKAIGLTTAKPIDSDSCAATTWHSLRHCDATHTAVSSLNCSCSSLPNFVLIRAGDGAVDSWPNWTKASGSRLRGPSSSLASCLYPMSPCTLRHYLVHH